MSYIKLKKAFESRAKGRDYKVFYAGDYARLTMDSDNAILVRVNQGEWVDGKYTTQPQVPVMRITEDDVMELIDDKFGENITQRNLMMKVAPGTFVSSDTSRFGSYTHTLRFRSPFGVNVPLTKGLKVNIRTGKILWHAPDTKRQTNRAAAAPVYDFVTKAKRMAEVLYRLGEFDSARGLLNWSNRDRIAGVIKETPMDEDHLSDYAAALFYEGRSRSTTYGRVEDRYKAYIDLGARRLREALKNKTGAFDLVGADGNGCPVSV